MGYIRLASIPPILIIATTTILGMALWGGFDFNILFLPASFHDLIYLSILCASLRCITTDRRYRHFYLVCWFIAGLFLVQSALQVFDIRPPGAEGEYSLYTDNIANGLYCLAFISTVSCLIRAKMLKWRGNTAFVYVVIMSFLAFNFLLTWDYIRSLLSSYAYTYDIIYYVSMYMIVLSVNERVNDFVRGCCNSVSDLLYRSGVYIRKVMQKAR